MRSVRYLPRTSEQRASTPRRLMELFASFAHKFFLRPLKRLRGVVQRGVPIVVVVMMMMMMMMIMMWVRV
jgi:hypothetical protein